MSEFASLEERTTNLTAGINGMSDGQKILVNKAFLEHVRADMVELLAFRKAQLMSDPLVTEFKTLFAEVQRQLGRLKELAAGAGENREKLEAALKAMLEAYGGK